jgi:hypothetical protein
MPAQSLGSGFGARALDSNSFWSRDAAERSGIPRDVIERSVISPPRKEGVAGMASFRRAPGRERADASAEAGRSIEESADLPFGMSGFAQDGKAKKLEKQE